MTATEYRQIKLSKFAARFGMNMHDLSALRRRGAETIRRTADLRCDRRSGWAAIADKAAAHGRSWEVVQ